MSNKKLIRIANAGGYWGDDPYALRRQLNGSLKLDYVSIDFLAEITMSIMQKQLLKDPTAGYARDFITQVEPLLKTLKEKNIKLITNAGGVNPKACAKALCEAASRQGVTLKVAVVEGDNITNQVSQMREQEKKSGNVSFFENMETKEDFSLVENKVLCANAYFGALPVVKALECHPDIVLCGRVTDTGITLAPLIHEFKWSFSDFNKLASGIVAGHIIECGAQATGGNFTDWQKVGSFQNMGFPILECEESGEFCVTKHPELDGLVSVQTVREQLVYEMGDPLSYLTPDVIANFSSIQLKQESKNKVRVSGVTGFAPTDLLKVSMAYSDGFKSSGALILSGPNAQQKAQVFADTFWKRLKAECDLANLPMPSQCKHEFIGSNSTHGGLSPQHAPATEIYLKFSVLSNSKESLGVFRKLLPSLILSGPSGVAVTGGAPTITDIVSYWPALIPQHFTKSEVSFIESTNSVTSAQTLQASNNWTTTHSNLEWPVTKGVPQVGLRTVSEKQSFQNEPAQIPKMHIVESINAAENSEYISVPLMQIAHARSGDKGDTANIGLIGRSAECYKFLVENISAELVQVWFTGMCFGKVLRYEVPNLHALNFLLEESLGGGGTTSLQIDPQGKTYSQALLRCVVTIPKTLLKTIDAEFAPCVGELVESNSVGAN